MRTFEALNITKVICTLSALETTGCTFYFRPCVWEIYNMQDCTQSYCPKQVYLNVHSSCVDRNGCEMWNCI